MKKALLLTLILVLTACSTVKTGYRLADWWIAWAVDDYVDWTADQQPQFESEVDSLLAWHQQTQLPRYRDWLLSVREDARGEVSVELLQDRVTESEAFARDVSAATLPAAARLLAALTETQREALADNLAAQQAEFAEEYLQESDQRRIKRRMDTVIENVERFTGKLHREQRERVRAWAEERGGTTELWLANRQQWIDQFMAAVNTHRDPASLEVALRPLFVDTEALRNPEYEAALAASQERVYRMLADLHASLDERQRARLDVTLGKWARWMEELAEEGGNEQLASRPGETTAAFPDA